MNVLSTRIRCAALILSAGLTSLIVLSFAEYGLPQAKPASVAMLACASPVRR